MNGCLAAISIDTGSVLDVVPMSRFCQECQVYDKLDKASAAYQKWKAKHKGVHQLWSQRAQKEFSKELLKSMASITQRFLVMEIVRASSEYKIHTKI